MTQQDPIYTSAGTPARLREKVLRLLIVLTQIMGAIGVTLVAPAAPAAAAPQAGSINVESIIVTGCYQNAGLSKATVSVQVGWTGLVDGDTITVELWRNGSLESTRTIDPQSMYDPGSGSAVAGPIVTPQVVAFETAADGSVANTNAYVVVKRSGPSGTQTLTNQNIGSQIPAPCAPLPCLAGSNLGGIAYIDNDADGVQDPGESLGAQGVTVTVFSATNVVQATTVTDAAGRWSITGTLTYPARVEFTNLPAFGFSTSTQQGTSNGSTVQFVSGPNCGVSVGVVQPAFYTQKDPLVSVPIWRSGDPLPSGSAAGLSPALVGFSYTLDSKMPAFGGGWGAVGNGPNPAPVTVYALASQVGSLWANAWNKQTERMFVAATLRRHVGLGPQGIGGLYVINPALSCNATTIALGGDNTCTPGAPLASWNVSTQLGVNVGAVSSNAARGLLTDPTQPTRDATVFNQIGTVGIGGMDLSEDGDTLYFINLSDKKLYSVDLSTYNQNGPAPTSANVTSRAIGSAGDPAPTCTGGNLRPWATKVYFGKVYVGMVCDAQTTQIKSNLKGFVYTYDPVADTWKKIFELPLTYPRGYPDDTQSAITGWYPWASGVNDFKAGCEYNGNSSEVDCSYPTPILSDLEFDSDGGMALGFGDRSAMQWGYYNYAPVSTFTPRDHNSSTGSTQIGTTMAVIFVGGDVLRAYYSQNTGSYVLENNAKAGPYTGSNPGNNQGPGFGEYFDDNFGPVDTFWHTEVGQGGLAVKPGSGQVIMNAMDAYHPFNDTGTIFAGGVRYVNSVDTDTSANSNAGKYDHAYDIYAGTNNGSGWFGKAASLGDLELLLGNVQTLQVGNRIWQDNNRDGVQDAGESGIAGLTVQLWQSNTVTGWTQVGTATTLADNPATPWDETGTYLFDSLSGLNMLSSTKLLLSHLYQIRLPLSQTVISGTIVTTQNFNSGTNSDMRDSDGDSGKTGSLNPGYSTIAFTSGTYGEVNHTFDIGLQLFLDLGNRVWYDTNNNGVLDTGEQPVAGVTVTLQTPTGTLTTQTNASGYYSFTNLVAGTYTPTIAAANFQSGGALFGYLSSTGASSTYTTTDNNRDHGIDPANLAAYLANGVSGASVTLGLGLQPVSEDSTAPATPNGDTQNNLTADFGFYAQQLGNTIWVDSNDDGLLNNGETPYANGPITVTLLNSSNNAVVSTTTTTNGIYTFTNVPSGTFVVSITVPANYRSSTGQFNTAGVDNNDNGAPSGVFIVSQPFTMTPGTNLNAITTSNGKMTNPSIDFGLYAPVVNLGNQVWYDTNDNGLIDAGEQGVQNVRVEVYRDTDNSGAFTPGVDQYVAFSNTVAGGYYTFTNLLEDNYVVVITSTNFNLGNTLAGYVSSTPTDATPNNNVDNNDNGIVTGNLGSAGYVASKAISLTVGSEPSTTTSAGDSNWTLDFGFLKLQVGDQVWLDSNNNGVRDVGESPISNVPVAILDNAGHVLQTTNTDSSGLYTFTGLISGTYVISITPPAGYVSSDGQTLTDANNDTDHGAPSGNTITSQPFALTAGGGAGTNESVVGNGTTQNLTLDFGLYVPVSLGNRVWFDTNNDGLDNENGTPGSSTGVAGVTVQLYQDSNNDGVFSTGDTLVSGTTTNSTGYYSFTQLKPTTFPTQTYLVVLPASNFTGNGPLVAYQSSTDIATTLTPDGNRDYDDNGVVMGGALGGTGFVASRPITLTSGNEPTGEINGANDLTADSSSNLTLDFGFYKLVLGNQVWRDTDNSGHLNGGEQGIPNLAVTLLDNAGSVVSTTTTDAGGYYTFTNLISGTYVVSVTTPLNLSSSTGAGNAYEPAPNPNTTGTDSDDNGTNSTGQPAAPFAVSAPLNLTPGSTNGGATPNNNNGTTTNPNLDFGFYPLGLNLGNQVWFDTNNNGLIDGSEQGVVGAVVELYRDTNGDTVFTPGTDVYVGAATTIAGGYYTFTGLLPDNYVVVITNTNFNLSGALLGYRPSTPVESDINANLDNQNNGAASGTLGSGGYVASKAISLTLGSEPSTTVVAGDSNWTVDFGFYRLELGNTVWNDKNNNGVQDAGESGVSGVTVTLFSNGNVVSTTVTDASGYYTFTNLASGTYSESIQMPAGYQSSSDIGSTGTPISTDRDDNGVGAGTVTVSTASFNLTPGLNVSGVQTATDSNGVTQNPSVDFGIWQPVSLGNQVWYDTNNNGVLDGGEAGVSGVTVELYRDNGDGVYTPGVDTLISTTTTIAGGYYTFTNLLEGGYVVVVPGANFTSGALAGYRSSTGSVTGESNTNNRDHGDENAGLANGSAPAFVASSVVTLTVGGEPLNDDLGSNGIDANGNGTIDFGFYKLELGNLVWEDKNNNGIVDSGEPAIPNVTVELRDPTSDALISTTTTNNAGYYTFTNLISGTYRVVLPASNFVSGGALAGLTSSTGVNGSASGPEEPGVNETNDLTLENVDHGTVFGALGSTGVVRSGVITMTPGLEPIVTQSAALSQQPTEDFGLFKPAGLGDYVWYDLNHNGVQNDYPGEHGVSGVTVTLYSNGVPISTTFTDATGFYVFTNLVQGTYSVTFGLPGSMTFTVPSGTTPDASNADSDATLINGQNGSTASFNLGYGEFKPQIDAGVFQPAGLGDTIWIDTNGNGLQENGEPGLPGVTATLYIYSPTANSFVQLSQTVTGNGGYYEFTNLISATYQVIFDTPAGYTWTLPTVGSPISDSNVITPSMGGLPPLGGGTAPVVLNAGEFNPTIDGGVTPYAALGDVVWEDINHNGFQDSNEPGVNGVQVTLYLNGSPIRTTTTANVNGTNGYYTFTSLISGTYSVTFGLPTGYQWTKVTPNSGDTTLTNAGGVNDSNVIDLSAGSTSAIVLKWGDQNPTIDAGIWRPASLGDYVWEDLNHNGIQNDYPGEQGVNGVTVNLLDSNGQVISTTTTFTGGPWNEPGYYTFTNLISGTYSVQFSLPNGYTWTLPNAGNDVSDNDASITGTTGSYTLFPGDSIPTVDAGVWRPASLGDTVWFDINHNGVQDGGAEVGVPNIGVTLLDNSGNVLSTTMTDANGLYTFTNLISATYQVRFELATLPPKYQPSVQGASGTKDLTDSDASTITGLTEKITLVAGENDLSWDFGIWLPASLGDRVWEDLNHNGQQDNGEPGVPNTTVTLLDSTNHVVSTTVTDSTGYYSFTQLVPTQYTVVFTPPAGGYTFTLPMVGITTTDSNPNPINGWTLPVILAPGEHNPTIDAGLWRPMSLGNQVWFDTNDNGKIDASEVGVDGVVVQLYADDGDGMLNLATDTLTRTTVTANGGYYTFTQLISGTYFAVVPSMNFAGTGALLRYQSSDPTTINPNNDADNDDNGITVGALGASNGYVASGPIQMRPGAEPTTANGEVAANGGDADANTNWTIDFGFYTLSLGNLVWNDINNNGLRDGTEAGVPNVALTLLDSHGSPISTTVTDASGLYTFTNLMSGTYSVRVNLPAGYQSSSDIASSSNPNNDTDNDDNGVGSAGGLITSNPITLWPGSEPQVNNATAASANPTLDFGIWRPFSLGNRVWNDVNNNGLIDAPDGAAPGIDGVLVKLLDTQGNVISTTTTSNGGYYRFDKLVAGDYIVEIAAGNFNAGNPLAGLRSSYIDDSNANSDVDRNDNGIGRVPSLTQGIRSGVVTLGTDAAPAEPTGETDLTPSGQGTDDNRANMTVDFGFFGPLVNLGNQVWFDINDNGKIDTGEAGMAGVTVELYRDSDNNGVYTPGVDVYVANRTTTAGGYYTFTNLVEGNYVVVIPGANFQPGGALASYRSSTFTESNPNDNVDHNDNGSEYGLNNDVPAYVASGAIELTVGDEPNTTIAAGDSNWSVDFGFWTPAKLQIQKTAQSATLVKKGDLITYTIVVTNVGLIVARDVWLTDTAPTGTSFVSASGVPVNPMATGSPTIWHIGDMQPGVVFTGKFVVRVESDSQAAGAIVNKAALGFLNEHVLSVGIPSNEVQTPFAPTAVTLAKFAATPKAGGGVRVAWQTSLERDTFGFNVWRSATGNRADAVQLNREVIVAKGGNALTDYALDDAGGSVNASYWLEEIELSGARHEYGPVSAQRQEPGAKNQEPAVQVAPSVGVAGGVPVAQAMVQNQEPAIKSQEPRAKSQESVVNLPATQAQPTTMLQGEPQSMASDAQVAEAQPAAQVQPEVQPVAAPAMAEAQPALANEAATVAQSAQVVEAVKTDAVAVARGGTAVQPTLRQAQGEATATAAVEAMAQPTIPLLPVGAGLLALFGVCGVGAFVVMRRRKAK